MKRLKSAQTLLDAITQNVCVGDHVVLVRVFERQNTKLSHFPLRANRLEDVFVAGLCERVIDDELDVLTVVLDLVLAQINDREGCRVLQVLGLDQGEELDPVTVLQRVFVQFFCKVDNYRRFFD